MSERFDAQLSNLVDNSNKVKVTHEVETGEIVAIFQSSTFAKDCEKALSALSSALLQLQEVALQHLRYLSLKVTVPQYAPDTCSERRAAKVSAHTSWQSSKVAK